MGTLLETESANTMPPRDPPRSPPTLTSQPDPPINSRLPSLKDQPPSPSRPIKPSSKDTPVESSTLLNADNNSTTPLPPLDTDPRTELSTTSSETPGVPHGESKDTSEWPLPPVPVSAESNSNPSGQPPTEFDHPSNNINNFLI